MFWAFLSWFYSLIVQIHIWVRDTKAFYACSFLFLWLMWYFFLQRLQRLRLCYSKTGPMLSAYQGMQLFQVLLRGCRLICSLWWWVCVYGLYGWYSIWKGSSTFPMSFPTFQVLGGHDEGRCSLAWRWLFCRCSVNTLHCDDMLSSMSLMKTRNKIGPRMDPCRTPGDTGAGIDSSPLTTMFWDLSARNDHIHSSDVPWAQYFSSFESRLPWGTMSKALKKSMIMHSYWLQYLCRLYVVLSLYTVCRLCFFCV